MRFVFWAAAVVAALCSMVVSSRGQANLERDLKAKDSDKVAPVNCAKGLRKAGKNDKQMWQDALDTGFVIEDDGLPIGYCKFKCRAFRRELKQTNRSVKREIEKYKDRYSTKKMREAEKAVSRRTASSAQESLVAARNTAAKQLSNRVKMKQRLVNRLETFCGFNDDA
mmetsp:Transcript_7761/g.13642  ORF Transcript_7761/g.13642 Transcript_7761/m.13642 type:complete len:168 (-) Transcript_7761:56-559(-)